MTLFTIQPLDESLRLQVADLIKIEWGSERVVARGAVWYPAMLPGYAAMETNDGKREIVGLVTYSIVERQCEIITLNSLVEQRGIGTALLAAVQDAARGAGCNRVWLITTNDNLPALHFYQKRGFHLVAVYPNALEASRRMKPEIPPIGLDGIPLRDEIELEQII